MIKTKNTRKFNELFNKGAEALKNGKLADAKSIFETLFKKNRTNVKLLETLGAVYGQLGEYEKSIDTFVKCTALNPKSVNAFHNLALAYEFSQQIDLAIKAYQQAISLSHHPASLLADLSDLYQKNGDLILAISSAKKALEKESINEKAYIALATSLSSANQTKEAEHVFKEALVHFPNSPRLLSNYSAMLQSSNNSAALDLAESYARQALAIYPDYLAGLNNFANIKIKKREFNEAKSTLDKILALDPNFVDAHINLGYLQHNMGNFELALSHFDNAIKLNPKNSTVLWYRSFTKLITGDYQTAWEDYEYGLLVGDRDITPYELPSFNSAMLNNDALLVTAEQGVGDQIMFSSCIVDLKKVTKNIIIECDSRLVPLYKRSFGIEAFPTNSLTNTDLVKKYSNLTQQIPIGSLPRIFRTERSRFHTPVPYLSIDTDSQKAWQQKYDDLGQRPKIGLSWRAGVIPSDSKLRSLSLTMLNDILKKGDSDFISLQYGNVTAEIREYETDHGIKIHDWIQSDSLKELDDFAAQISALDCVISVGNTNVHLAGSLNIPTFCLIPYVPSWRWLFEEKQSVWYDSVKIYRQSKNGSWDKALQELKKDLDIFTNGCTDGNV